MRFMMLMIPLGYESAPPDVELDPERVAAMMRYNEALKDAGVLITLDGLHPPSTGARVSFAGGKPIVTDGPFAEAKEVLGGYWMIEVASREEAIAGPSNARPPTTRSSRSARFRRWRIFPLKCSRPRRAWSSCGAAAATEERDCGPRLTSPGHRMESGRPCRRRPI